MSLATKYRPSNFNDVIGQGSTVKVLKKQIQTGNIKNAYIFSGASGTGKAQPLTSKIYTTTGYTLMQDIGVGDVILDGKGRLTTVTGVFPQGERDIFTITFNDGSSIEVSDNHLMEVYCQKANNLKAAKEYYTLTTLELLEHMKDHNHFFVDLPCIQAWKDSDILLDPYLVGCLLGDGGLCGNLTFASMDDDIIKAVTNKLEKYDYTLIKYPSSTRPSEYHIRPLQDNVHKYQYSYNNKTYFSADLLRVLQDDGFPITSHDTLQSIVGRSTKTKKSSLLRRYPELEKIKVIDLNISQKSIFLTYLDQLNLRVASTEKRIPQNYLYSSISTRVALLQGLLDTDGCGSNGSIEFCVANKGLAQDMCFLVRSLGGYASIREKSTKYFNKKYNEVRAGAIAYRVYIHLPNTITPFCCQRKLAMYNVHSHKEPKKYITNIAFSRRDLCQCIYVNSIEHTYITDNLTVTHNTTLARIFAKELNNMDNSAIEIDGASNNGVDNVRNIIGSANERSVSSTYKVFIIDEAHMLTTAAWNAFLKTIEEPPKFTIFIFCTTNPNKIPDTIKNRCQRFNFTKIPSILINERLKYISCQEGFTNFEPSCDYISKNCNNQMRDAITLLEQVAEVSTTLNLQVTSELLGGSNIDCLFNIINAILDGDQKVILENLNTLFLNTIDIKAVVDALLGLEIDLNKYIIFNDMQNIKTSAFYEDKIKNAVNFDNASKYHSYILNNLLELAKLDSLTEQVITAYLLKISRFE